LWEFDIPTGLHWRISSKAGDETEPVWSADGRNLAYVAHNADGWSLVLRPLGEPEQRLAESRLAIHAPSWRPDGSLITFLKETDSGYSLYMAILASPPVVRPFRNVGKDIFLSRVVWPDRNHMIYAADGKLLIREFDDRRATPIPFRAKIGTPSAASSGNLPVRHLPAVTAPTQRLVIRSARLFDGSNAAYRRNIDVLIDGATISAVEPRHKWPGVTILDLGNATILPGFIDIDSALPVDDRAALATLAYGVTTIVSGDNQPGRDTSQWQGEKNPGPRVLRAGSILLQGRVDSNDLYLVTIAADNAVTPEVISSVRWWQQHGVPVLSENRATGLEVGVNLALGTDSITGSPPRRIYQDTLIAYGGRPVILVAGLANASTPGLDLLLNSRQALRFGHDKATTVRKPGVPEKIAATATVVIGSRSNGLPPGLSVHAELLALAAAGLHGGPLLRAAGTNSGKVLGFEQQLGRVTPGAFADLVLVSGDPLANIADALKIVAVVHNGRFYSLINLLERGSAVAEPMSPAINVE